MALVRQSTWPTLRGSPFADFFDDDRFFNSPWFRGRNLPAVNVKENDKALGIANGLSRKKT